MKYPEYKAVSYAEVADEILTFWKENDVFSKSITERQGFPTFTFYEGPPSANGTPGIHHVMARTIKDIFCRYKTLKGYQVNRKGGWDTHGLPVELQVEKELGITKEDIGKKISVAEYNQKCREAVMRFTGLWADMTDKMGYWVDMDDPYITYKNEYIESLWHLLKKLYDKGLLYKGYTIQPYSPAAGTGLSSHELNQPGTYRDVKDTSMTAQFKVKKDGKSQFLFDAADSEEVFVLAWTTTPWTLPSNTALTVGAGIEYALVKTFNPYTHLPVNVVLAYDRIGAYFNEKGKDGDFEGYAESDKKTLPWLVLKTCKGSDLEGIHYEQLLPYVQPEEGDAFRVITGDFVTTEDGTGVVHTAPTFGADDFRVAQQNGVPAIMVKDENGKDMPLVDKKGRFVKEVTDFPLEYVKAEYYTEAELEEETKKQGRDKYLSVDERISIKLKEENRAFNVQKYEHSYPHCWRTDKPVLYYPLDSWFIRTTEVKDKLAKLNKTINWKPESTGTGRFGNWLENLVDWNLSRSRYWGTPLPIWRANLENEICIGSIDDLKNDGWFYLGGQAYEEVQRKVLMLASEPENNIKSLINEDSVLLSLFGTGAVGEQIKTFAQSEMTGLEWKQVISDEQYFKGLLEPAQNYLTTEFDLHRPYVDNLVYFKAIDSPPFGKRESLFVREPDLIDVWFDSGAMPYAQWHMPFENQEIFDKAYPADFISEGVDQTRGWFFTLHAIAGMLYDSVAFKNVVSTGLVLDKNGNKMSKRLGNAIDPFETLKNYGADPTRWYMITNAQPWDNLRFDPAGVTEVRNKFFGTLTNTYNFFALYANLDGYRFTGNPDLSACTELDKWILSRLQSLIKEVDAAYEDYEPTRAGRAIQEFVSDQLSNWYVRLGRRRFWKGEMTEDKKSAYETLGLCLKTVSQLMSPIAPFYADWLYKNLTGDAEKLSVHLSDMPVANESWINEDLQTSMDYAQRISSMIHALRKANKLKVRQPLSKVLIPVLSKDTRRQISSVDELIKTEVNIKAVEYLDDDSGVLSKKVKPNFKTLGPKYGKNMKDVAAAINGMSKEDLKSLEKAGKIQLAVGEIELSDVEIQTEDLPGYLTAQDGNLTVALDITLTEELKQEGIARDFVNKIQNYRKDSGFEVTDKIHIQLQNNNEELAKAINVNKAYICEEVQALSLEVVDNLSDASELEMDEFVLVVKVGVI